MMNPKKEIVEKLQKQILALQGIKSSGEGIITDFGIPQITRAFANGILPTGVIHEFLATSSEDAAASGGFISGLLSTLMKTKGICIWISTKRTIYPPALKTFGISPDRVLFIDLDREKDILWVTEEALKCSLLAGVVTEINEISFAQSRRLQLMVEKSKVTGFLIRRDPEKLSSTTCVARWKITSIPSQPINGMPGLGFPRWQVELLKVRNGMPGSWKLSFIDYRFQEETKEIPSVHLLAGREAG